MRISLPTLTITLLTVAFAQFAQVPCSKSGTNTPPIVNDDFYAWPPPAVLNVLANDSDPDLDPLTITGVSQVAGGTATVSADRRSIAFTPVLGATSGSLIYTVSDGVNAQTRTGNVTLNTAVNSANFTWNCAISKCTFTVDPGSTANARWFNWKFGDQTTKERWTGFNVFKEYPIVTLQEVSRKYDVTLEIDYLDGSRGVRTHTVELRYVPENVEYKILDGLSGIIVNDIVPMTIRVEFLSSTFGTSSNTTNLRYRYYLESPNAVAGPNEFGGTSFNGAPVGATLTLQFKSEGLTELGVWVEEEEYYIPPNSTSNVGYWRRTTKPGQSVGQRTVQVVDKPPIVRIAEPPGMAGDGTATFNTEGSFDDRGLNATDFTAAWDFGDGEYGQGEIRDGLLLRKTHPYKRPGTFKAYVTLTDHKIGHATTASASVTVANRAPKAAFTFTCAGLECLFDGSTSTDEEDLTRFDWGFGDGAGGAGLTATRTFTAPGCYQVDLIVTDNAGVQHSTRRTVAVSNQQLAYAGMAAADSHSLPGLSTSNLNGLLEPGETVLIETARTNPFGQTTLYGTLMNWTAPGGIYTTVDGQADYGMVDANARTNCWATGNCFAVSLQAPSGRPQLHWDGTVSEQNSLLGFKEFKIHIGNSFADVPPTNIFYPDVEALLHWGVTLGCGGNNYCPGPATRRQFVTMLMRARSAKSGAQPPACTAPPFLDVPCGDVTAQYITEAKNLGITNGCGGGNFCPEAQISRAEAAVLIVRALGVTPPPCSQTFNDVQCVATATTPKHWAADFISEIYRRGITTGCTVNPPMFCPADVVRRDMAATLLVRAFGLEVAFPQCPRGTSVVGAADVSGNPE